MINELYSLWCKNAVEDSDLFTELKSIADMPGFVYFVYDSYFDPSTSVMVQ